MSRALRIQAFSAFSVSSGLIPRSLPGGCLLVALAVVFAGCEPETSPLVRDGSVQLRSMEPALETSMGASAVLKFSYRWEARQDPGPNAVLSVSMRFDRTDGGVRSWTLLEDETRRSGVDSGAIFLTPEIVGCLKRPVCGRLLMTEAVNDSLVAFLAESDDFCWAP